MILRHPTTLFATFVLLIGLAAAPPAHGQIYVDKNATGDSDGSSWADAHTDLQDAIDAADGSSEIWIAEGVYKPDGEGDSFTITGNKDGIEVYGGFDGTESNRDERAPKEHRTILSGDLNGDDTDSDGDGIIEDADPNQDGTPENLNGGENTHHVLVLDGGNIIGPNVSDNVTNDTVIDGLVVTAGQADSGSGSDNDGGGLYCDGYGDGNECSPTLRNVVFAGNAASDGGAMFNDGGSSGTASPHITNATFAGNAVAERGGAMFNNGGSSGTGSPQMTNVTFTSNAANFGGAIYNLGIEGTSSPQITNATFTGNAATNNGGAIYNDAIVGGTASSLIANTILWGNSATNSGSEIYNKNAAPTLTHTIIEGGTGGIEGTVTSTTFLDDNGDPAGSFGASTNLDQDPFFADASAPAGADGRYGTLDDGLTVESGSPALDAGDNGSISVGTDITGAPRKQDRDGDGDATVNIGAYEVNRLLPMVQSPSTATVAARSADLTSTVDPSGLETDVTFKYRETGASSFQSVTAAESPLTGNASQSVSATASGLSPQTEYEVRVEAENTGGTTESNFTTFTTEAILPPSLTTGSVQNVTGTTADITATLNPNNSETALQGQYYPSADPSKIKTITASASPFSGTTSQNVTVTLGALSPDTEYRARLVGSNSKGGVEGSFVTFTTTSDGYTRTITGTDGTGNDAGWRMLALPAADKTRAALEGDLTFSTNSGSILYRWSGGSWAAQTASSDDLPRGRGFMLYFFDDALDPIGSDGIPLAIGTGSEDQSLNHQVTNLAQGETFHLLGNPFDVAFDLSELNLAEQGFQQTVQIWDRTPMGGATGGSGDYIVVTQTDGDSDVIGAWQGFFVQRDPNADTNGESLTFATAGKQDGPGVIYESMSPAVANTERTSEKRLRLGLRLAVTDTTASDTGPPSPKAGAAGPTRETPDSLAAAQSSREGSSEAQPDTIGTGRLGLLLSSESSGGWDAYEATQLGPPGGGQAAVTLSSPLEMDGSGPVQRALASEPYPMGSSGDRSGESATVTVPVSVRANTTGGQATIRLSDAQREAIPSGWALRLTDTKTGEQTDLLADSYRFALEEGDGTGGASPSESRFRLAVGPRESLPTLDDLTLEAPYPNPTSGPVTVEYAVPQEQADGAQLQLYDVLGRRVRTVAVKPGPRTRRLDVGDLASGVYILRLTAEGMQQTRKLTVVR